MLQRPNLGGKLARLVESMLLIGALIIVIPIPPSGPERIEFFPLGVISIIMFAISRYIRHALTDSFRLLFLVAEVIIFSLVQYILFRAANILLDTAPPYVS